MLLFLLGLLLRLSFLFARLLLSVVFLVVVVVAAAATFWDIFLVRPVVVLSLLASSLFASHCRVVEGVELEVEWMLQYQL